MFVETGNIVLGIKLWLVMAKIWLEKKTELFQKSQNELIPQ